jgi:tRNA dimethylallyltransferase
MQTAPVEPDEHFRESLDSLPNATLLERLYEKDPVRAATIDQANRRRLIRALEIIKTLGTVPPIEAKESPYEWLVIGIDIDKEKLHQNIHTRLLERLEAGMIEEVQELHKTGVSYERLDAFGLEYRFIKKFLQKELAKDEMIVQLETRIRQFAKRQMTWLKRDQNIEWYTPKNHGAAIERVEVFLRKE